MRIFLKHTVRCLLFLAILLGLLLLASQIFIPKNNIMGDGMRDAMANGILTEPAGTIDALILGDSETYSSMIPLQMWRDYGQTVYCCGTPGQKLCYSMEFLEKTFRDQSPKVVILETDTIFRDFTYGDAIVQRLDNALPVLSYHNRWKSLSAKDLSLKVKYTYIEQSKGYQYDTSSQEASEVDYMKPTTKLARVTSQNRLFVKEINEYCEERGAKLLLVSTPSTKNWNYMRHNTVQAIADESNIAYIDLNLLREEVPIDWKKDSRDKGDHLNHFGAEKVSAYLGKYLSETLKLEDHRGDERYQNWTAALDAFNQATSNCLKKKQK